MQQGMIDLNELPDDVNDELSPNVGVENGDLMSCTQPPAHGGEAVNNEKGQP